MGQFGFESPFLFPEKLRNGDMWILESLFSPKNARKWVNSDFRSSSFSGKAQK